MILIAIKAFDEADWTLILKVHAQSCQLKH